jgi:hypothetical protein
MSYGRCTYIWIARRAMPDGSTGSEKQECKLDEGHEGPHKSFTGCKRKQKIKCPNCGQDHGGRNCLDI